MLLKYVLPVMIALVIGGCLAIQPIFNTAVSKSIGMWYAALCSLAVTITIVGTVCFMTDQFRTLREIPSVPKLYIFAGMCGAFILGFTIYCMLKIGPVLTASLTVTAQMTVATVCAHYGWFGFDKEPINGFKILGIVLLILGVVFVKLSISK